MKQLAGGIADGSRYEEGHQRLPLHAPTNGGGRVLRLAECLTIGILCLARDLAGLPLELRSRIAGQGVVHFADDGLEGVSNPVCSHLQLLNLCEATPSRDRDLHWSPPNSRN